MDVRGGAVIRGSSESTVTPEAVLLHTDIAGIGSRSIAYLLDTLIQVAVLVPVLIVPLGDGVDGTGEAVVVAAVLVLVLWFYFPAFELLRHGQTPGKRYQGIRVVRTDGQPAGLAPVLVRNLVRIVDVTLLPFLALISMVVTRRSQRLGDLAAGTMVVRERALPAPDIVPWGVPGNPVAPTLDTSRLTERDYTVLRTFLARRTSLDEAARRQLAERLAARVREQIHERPGDPVLANERLIELVAQSYRARFTDRPG
jgi:uncharacterized RDD family membrane protein YckC